MTLAPTLGFRFRQNRKLERPAAATESQPLHRSRRNQIRWISIGYLRQFLYGRAAWRLVASCTETWTLRGRRSVNEWNGLYLRQRARPKCRSSKSQEMLEFSTAMRVGRKCVSVMVARDGFHG